VNPNANVKLAAKLAKDSDREHLAAYTAWLTSRCPIAEHHHNEIREGFSDYVAELQLHMTLQARNLVPNLANPCDSRERLLQETQADIEKLISRQMR